MARLDRLVTAKGVAQYASVIGRQVSYELLQAVSELGEVMLQHELGRLVDAELVYQRGLPPQAMYTFKHTLVQDTAYESLLRSTRQGYHHRIAEVLEDLFPATVDTQPELLAHHYTEAGLNELAVGHWHKAGQQAVQRSANVEAISHLKKGLELLKMLPETSERLQQELDFQVAPGLALHVTKGHAAPELERAYDRAKKLCEQVGNTSQLFPVLRGLIVYTQSRGNLQQAHELGEQLLYLAESHPTPEHLMLAHYQMGQVLYHWGQPASASTHHLQALSMYNPQEHHDLGVRYGNDLGVGAHGFLSWSLWQLGYPDQAMQHSDKAHMQAEATRTLTAEQGFVLWWAMGTILHGWALAMQGQEEVGIAEMHQGLAAAIATGDKLLQPRCQGILAEAYGEDRHPEEGLSLLDEAVVVIEGTGARSHGLEDGGLADTLLSSGEC